MDKVIFIGAIVSGVVFIILAIILAINTANGCGGSKSDDGSTTTAEAESIKSTQTKVPNVVGKSEDEAVQMLSRCTILAIRFPASTTIPFQRAM